MKRCYAINARDLLESRKHGHKPAAPLTVSLVRFDGYALHVRPDMPPETLDWRMVVDLDVRVLADTTVPLSRVVQVCADVAMAKPLELELLFLDQSGMPSVIDIGSGTHRWAIPEQDIPAEHSFCWMPITATPTPIARRLRAALCAKKPKGLNP